MSALIEFKEQFYIFCSDMLIKLQKSEKKHKNDTLDYKNVKEHFVDEIIECFMLEETKADVIKEMLMSQPIDEKELVDVANMSFAMRLVWMKYETKMV